MACRILLAGALAVLLIAYVFSRNTDEPKSVADQTCAVGDKGTRQRYSPEENPENLLASLRARNFVDVQSQGAAVFVERQALRGVRVADKNSVSAFGLYYRSINQDCEVTGGAHRLVPVC